MTAEDLLKTYYSLKDIHDSQEAELDGKPIAVRSYDEIYEMEKVRQENIRAHRNDIKYAQELLQKEYDRGNEISDRKREYERRAAGDRQRQYNENAALEALRLDDIRRREDNDRWWEENRRRQEEDDLRRYEEECRRREEEEYRRRRQADEEYYAQLRERNR